MSDDTNDSDRLPGTVIENYTFRIVSGNAKLLKRVHGVVAVTIEGDKAHVSTGLTASTFPEHVHDETKGKLIIEGPL